MNAERAGLVFDGRRLRGRGAGEVEGRERLPTAQPGDPPEQVGDEQHAQGGDVRSAGGPRRVRADPQHSPSGGPDLGTRTGLGVEQAKHVRQAICSGGRFGGRPDAA
jgi:hypothetical protein